MSKRDDARADPRVGWPSIALVRMLLTWEKRAAKRAKKEARSPAFDNQAETIRHLKDLRELTAAADALKAFAAHRSRACNANSCECGVRVAFEAYERKAAALEGRAVKL